MSFTSHYSQPPPDSLLARAANGHDVDVNALSTELVNYATSSSSSAIANNDSSAATASNPTDEIDRTLHPSGIIPELQNIVCTVNLGCRLDLKSIAMRARNAEFNPRRFSAVIMRIRQPKATCLVFSSGKMVVTGSKTEDDAKIAARKFARIIQKLGFNNVGFHSWKIENMVASADVKFPIRLEGLNYEHEDYSSFEPELFPGLIYRMVQPKIVLLIFVSGKLVLTGGKRKEDLWSAFENIYPVLLDYRKPNVNVNQQDSAQIDDAQQQQQVIQQMSQNPLQQWNARHANNG